MALRSGHGTGAGSPRIEVLPPPEQPWPVAGAPAGQPQEEPQAVPPTAAGERPGERRADGTFEKGARTVQSMGWHAMKASAAEREEMARLSEMLGLSKLSAQSAFAPYRDRALEFLATHKSELAMQAGGEVGPAPLSMVASAALQLASSRFLQDRACETGDPALFKQASQLANDSRQNLLAAYELAVREAEARRQAVRVDPADAHTRLAAALTGASHK